MSNVAERASTTVTQPTVVWMWQHYQLHADVFDSVEEALAHAYYMQEYGEGSLSSIETADGVVSDEQYEEFSRQRDEESRVERAAAPKMTHKVVVRDPSGKDDAWLDSYATEDEARAAFDALPAWLRSSGRARVQPLR